MVTNFQVATVMNQIADLLEVKGESSFRYNAYREAGRQLEALNEDIAILATEGRLRDIDGVGDAIAKKIDELIQTGKLEYFEKLKLEVPPTLVELLHIPGLGPKKIQVLHKDLGIASITDLRAALDAGTVQTLPGMGAKTAQRLLVEIERWQERTRRTPIGVARPAAEQVIRLLRATGASIDAIEPAGSLRRWLDTIGDIDIVCASSNPESVLDAFVSLPVVKEVIGRGPTKASVLTLQNLQMDLRVVALSSYGAAIQYFTGSKAHNIKVRTLAQRMKLTLNEYGLAEDGTGRLVASATEAEIYNALGMDLMPPEMREDLGEVELSAQHKLPRLIEETDILGELHSHTTFSDGSQTVEDAAMAAVEAGMSYLAITDHSQSLGITGGMTPERVREQWIEIDRVNALLARHKHKLKLLKGVELEILADGTLDFEDELLAGFDIVIASVHSNFRQDRETMTRRMIAATMNKHVDVIGHPSGRLIGRRDGYEVDMDALLRAAAANGVAVEINANPVRLDLDAQHARLARTLGIQIPINTDAHAPDHFEFLRYGIATARRAWLGPEHVLNTRPLKELLAWLEARSAR